MPVMDNSIATTLQTAVETELARRFDLEDGTMAEYVVVMLQNGKDAQGITAELNDLVSNYDASFTDWVFLQISRLQSGQSIEFPTVSNSTEADRDTTAVQDQDVDMEVENGKDVNKTGDQGMGYPSSRLYSGLKKTLQENSADSQTSRHRPGQDGIRSTPYGTVAVGTGAMRVPTGPRNTGAGPVRTSGPRSERQNGRQARNGMNGIPEMPQFPGFPTPAEFFANLPMMAGIDGAPSNLPRVPSRRCTKWPTCFKGKACTFGHPTTVCQNSKCRKTDGSCPSMHTDEDIDLLSGMEAQRKTEEIQEAKAAARENQHARPRQTDGHKSQKPVQEYDGSAPICKFGEACTNRACHFSHPSPASKNGSSIVLHAESCQEGMSCKDEQCSYSHPSPSNQYTPGVKLNPQSTATSEIHCKFHPCLNPACRFQHAPNQQGSTKPVFGGARNKVWTPNHATAAAKPTAERTFVDGEAEEQFTSESNVHDNDTEMIK